MSYHHRPAVIEDLPAIVDIYNHAVLEKTSTCDVEPVSVSSRRAWFDSAYPDRYPIWVGFEPQNPDTVTGYITFDPFLNGRPGYDLTADVALYVHPDHRGRRQGSYLLGNAIEHAPTLGVRNLATTIFASNETSLRLFGSHGFREWGRLPAVADLGGGVVHDVVFVGRTVA